MPPAVARRRRVARQTQSTQSGCSGNRAHSSQRGKLASSPSISSGLTAMWTFAGKTATSSAISHQRASSRVAGGITAMPPATSATPLISTARFGDIGMYGGTIASYRRGITKCMIPAKVKKAARSRCERVIARQSRRQVAG